VAALFMPMMPETVAASLAVIKLGGIILPLFSGYGAAAVAERLRDSEAKFLFTVDGFYRRGQTVLLKPIADEALNASPSVQHVLVLKRLGISIPWTPNRDVWWRDEVGRQSAEAQTERTDAEDPMMIIYTSGTTGRPKGAVHTHCGFPIKAAQDMLLGFDVRQEDVLYWVTDMGWMMGPWEVFGTTLIGATMVLYEGALDFPGPDRLWSLVEQHRVSILGVSPTLIRSLMRHGTAPAEKHDLSSLRILGSTGEPWNPDPWLWYFRTAGKGRLPIINYSGGTETSGGLVTGNVLTPLKPCAFSGAVPGIAADVVDEDGMSVRGQVGELVVRKPWIGMTRGFWKDPERYFQTYWSRFPDVWVHGDWAAVDKDGLWYILGRSDDTIKIAGKRLGPAEVESVLVGHPAVSEAAAVGIPDPIKGEALICFCVLKPGSEVNVAWCARVAEQLGKPLPPEILKFLNDLPKTHNAKIMRRIVRASYLTGIRGDLCAGESAGVRQCEMQSSDDRHPHAAAAVRRSRRRGARIRIRRLRQLAVVQGAGTRGLRRREGAVRKGRIKEIPLSEIKDDLSRFLREAEKQEIVTTRHGKRAGVLIGFESEDDWFDYKLENDPRFLERLNRRARS
jgi:acetyl-CoA synthetase